MTTDYRNHTLIASMLTRAAPASNSHGSADENTLRLQQIQWKNRRYSIVSGEAIRNGLREVLIHMGLPHNRTRVYTENQLAVKMEEFPDPEKYADDFLFGFMATDKKACDAHRGRPHRRPSLVHVNIARAITPSEDLDTLVVQSPLHAQGSAYQNSKTSALLMREVDYNQFMYPLQIGLRETFKHPDWSAALLRAVGQLTHVAGNHARTYFEMAPQEMVVCLTTRASGNFDLYGYREDNTFAPLDMVRKGVLPASEFWVGGETVSAASDIPGIHAFDSPLQMIEALCQEIWGA